MYFDFTGHFCEEHFLGRESVNYKINQYKVYNDSRLYTHSDVIRYHSTDDLI